MKKNIQEGVKRATKKIKEEESREAKSKPASPQAKSPSPVGTGSAGEGQATPSTPAKSTPRLTPAEKQAGEARRAEREKDEGKPIIPLGTLADHVKEAASRVGPEGRLTPTSDKAFINHVYRQFSDTPHGKGMSLDDFKHHLTLMNTNRHLDLSRADLVEAMNPDDVKESETLHRPMGNQGSGSAFHFVRAEQAKRAEGQPAEGATQGKGQAGQASPSGKPGKSGQPAESPEAPATPPRKIKLAGKSPAQRRAVVAVANALQARQAFNEAKGRGDGEETLNSLRERANTLSRAAQPHLKAARKEGKMAGEAPGPKIAEGTAKGQPAASKAEGQPAPPQASSFTEKPGGGSREFQLEMARRDHLREIDSLEQKLKRASNPKNKQDIKSKIEHTKKQLEPLTKEWTSLANERIAGEQAKHDVEMGKRNATEKAAFTKGETFRGPGGDYVATGEDHPFGARLGPVMQHVESGRKYAVSPVELHHDYTHQPKGQAPEKTAKAPEKPSTPPSPLSSLGSPTPAKPEAQAKPVGAPSAPAKSATPPATPPVAAAPPKPAATATPKAPPKPASPTPSRDRSPGAAASRIQSRVRTALENVGRHPDNLQARKAMDRLRGRDLQASGILRAKEAGQAGYFGKLRGMRESGRSAPGAATPPPAPAPSLPTVPYEGPGKGPIPSVGGQAKPATASPVSPAPPASPVPSRALNPSEMSRSDNLYRSANESQLHTLASRVKAPIPPSTGDPFKDRQLLADSITRTIHDNPNLGDRAWDKEVSPLLPAQLSDAEAEARRKESAFAERAPSRGASYKSGNKNVHY